jgi:hypothetical protein
LAEVLVDDDFEAAVAFVEVRGTGSTLMATVGLAASPPEMINIINCILYIKKFCKTFNI